MERKIIAANWKMYKVQEDVDKFFGVWKKYGELKNEIVIIPQAPLLSFVKRFLSYEKLGAQNCSDKKEGAFTGEISPYLLKDIGCDYVLIGHSERRHIFGEKNEIMGGKINNAIEANLRPIYCVGEKLEEREEGKTIDVIYEQLSVLKGLIQSGYDIAYEPVWAIGTGKVAKKEDASFVQGKIKEYLSENNIGKDSRILYGGSVKPDNSAELLSAPNVDGLLVGGA
ncbi:MAG: triose-phosphate isomerase, partial [Acidobacteria bacterium]|nr:triose-phosphate isomerase [Acidobacteriota bacterium]